MERPWQHPGQGWGLQLLLALGCTKSCSLCLGVVDATSHLCLAKEDAQCCCLK